MSECKCTMAKSVLGDGCPQCQPQTYIKELEGWLSEERQEAEALRQHAEAMAEALSGLADLANHFNVSGVYFTEDDANRDALELAETVLTAYRAESAKGGV